MSLEDKIEALTAALEANTKALGGASTGTKSAGTKSAGTKSAGTKSAGTKKATVTVDTVAEKFGAFLNTGSVAAKKKAKLIVKGIVDNYDVERITKIDSDSFEEALGFLKQYQDGDDPLGLFDEEEEDDDGMV